MGKVKDIAGQKFYHLTAIEMVGLTKQGAMWRCLCDCGEETVVSGGNLRHGNTRSCGCTRALSNMRDISDQRFGRLVAKYALPEKRYNKTVWHCLCDCGNECDIVGASLWNGLTQSCGCLHSEMVSEKYFHDLTGKKFGRLTVLQRISQIGAPKVIYRCQCDCGTIKDVAAKDLVKNKNNTSSCGCYQKELLSRMNRLNLVGQRFGKLLVIEDTGTSKQNKAVWKCMCDCGNECYVTTDCLRGGYTTSCGCIQSRGENRIEDFLKFSNIRYEKQKRFIGCKDVRSLPFDFYLRDYNIAIEFDGRFHYEVTEVHNDLSGQQRRDAIKTKYCEENDIILLRIPYWEKDNIESILTDWLFLNDEETEEAGETA